MNLFGETTSKYINKSVKAAQFIIQRKHTLSQIFNRAKYEQRNSLAEVVGYKPWHLTIYPTDRCTLRCKMCLHSSRNQELNPDFTYPIRNDMNFGTFKKIVDQFKDTLNICIAGIGEPLLNKDLFEMVEYANNKKIEVVIITNGTLLDKFFPQIINSKISCISISLNALTPEEYSVLTGVPEKLFSLVLNNISSLTEIRDTLKPDLEVRLSFVCTRSNFRRIPEMIRIARSLKVDHLDLHNLIPSESEGLDKHECLFEDDTEIKEFFEKECKRLYDDLKVTYPKLLKKGITERRCKMPFYYMGIDAEGNISAGCRVLVPSEKFGNVFKDEDVWNNQHMREIRRMLLDESVPLMETCKLCVENC
jgi:MoaA/NifB/PqqE/SkfB family radical SAM enzyme